MTITKEQEYLCIQAVSSYISDQLRQGVDEEHLSAYIDLKNALIQKIKE